MRTLNEIINSRSVLTAGLEAKLLMKAKTITVQRTDYMVTNKPSELVTVYPIGTTEEEALNIFKELSDKTSKLKVMKMKGYYIKPFVKEVIASKRVAFTTREAYKKVSGLKKEYGIGTVSINPKTFSSMSYMVNMSYTLDAIKAKTIDTGLPLNTKLREDILECIKRNIAETTIEGRDNVLYFKGPFLANTSISTTIVDSELLKVWRPVLLLLEWFYKEPIQFKKWMIDNKINIVFDAGNGQHLVLSRSELFSNIPMFNAKYIMKLLHKLDGTDLNRIGYSDSEINEVEINETDEDRSTPKEALTEFLNVDNEKEMKENNIVTEEDTDIPDDIQVIEENAEELKDSQTIRVTKDTMDKLFTEVSPEERAETLSELHNYTALKKDIETSSVAKLRKKMIKNYDVDIKAVVNKIVNHKIDVANFNNEVDNDYNSSTFINLDKSYQAKLSDADLLMALTSPSELSVPLFLKSYTKEDVSDREFRGYLLKAKYETHQGEELELELEVPTCINNSIFIGGSNKYLTNQDMSKPIKKEDMTVIMTMAYNKTILSIKGKYASAFDKTFVKTILNFSAESDAVKVKTTEKLSDFIYQNRMSYRMIHLNKHFGGIRYKKDGVDIDFDFRGVDKDEIGTICGEINGSTIYHNPNNETFWLGGIEEKIGTTEFILSTLKLIDADLLERSTVTKLDNLNFVNGIYCKIMARELPIILVMLIETPLKDLLDRLKKENDLEYSVVSNSKLDISKLKNDTNYGYIILEDYTIRIKYNNIINQLILVPLVNMDLTSYNVFDIAHIMKNLVGSDNTSIYLENFASSFISGADRRVLEMYNIPSDFTGAFIYAASLFYDYKTFYSSDVANYRLVTPTEVINRIIYETISKEFSNNAARTKRGSRQTINIPKDAVIRSLQTTMANISEDSNISPFRTIMLKSSKSQKGHMGINLARAYNMKRRMFFENNLGAETFASAYSGQGGIVKYLPFNPKLVDLTGSYFNQNNPKDLKPSNLHTFMDSILPYLTKDDSPRRIMANGQGNHIVSVVDADPMLCSSGADEAAVYMAPEFSYIAEEDGEVIGCNETFVTVKYKNKKVISYRLNNVERNSAKGYYMKNDFIIDDKIKLGKKVKKGTVLAYNKDFFKRKNNGKVALCVGPLVPVLICDGEGTWEDSVTISRTLSNRMATKLIKRITAKFNMNTVDILDVNLDIGSHVNPDSLLIKYNNLSDDIALNQFFTDVEGINTHDVEAHYKGSLNDITVYYRLSRDTVMTKSIKKFLKDVEVVQSNKNHMKDLDNNTEKFNIAVNTSKPQLLTRGKFSKINGDVIENGEMLIEFNVEVEDKVGTSDKLVVASVLKGEPTAVIEDVDRPYGELTGRRADIMIDTQSVNARKTPSLPLHGDLLGIILHTAIKNRMILNMPPEKGSLLDYKSSMPMVKGTLKYKGGDNE